MHQNNTQQSPRNVKGLEDGVDVNESIPGENTAHEDVADSVQMVIEANPDFLRSFFHKFIKKICSPGNSGDSKMSRIIFTSSENIAQIS